ncbi:hypothetical protein [Vibrio sp. TRT 1302]|uniref:hypothetical protein n=1 Tax=Vibrio sp. TRT 1302 TaxID=3418504 RepID=UPI003CEA46CA
MNLDFLFGGLEANSTHKPNACVKCSSKIISGGFADSICLDCRKTEAYVNEFRGNCPEAVLTAMFNLDVCKRRIATIFEQEKLGVELDLAVVFDIETKIQQVLILLEEVPDKSEPVKHIYISCAEIRDLINSRNILSAVS